MPFLYTQSISEVGKQSIRQAGVKVLMRQTLDIDLNRYAEYIRNCTPARKKAISAFPHGKAVVILSDGRQQVVQFHERESQHTSHTPLAQAALVKFAACAVDITSLKLRDMTATAEQRPTQTRKRAFAQKATGKVKHAPSIKQRIYTLLENDTTLTSRQLVAIVGCPQNTAQLYMRLFQSAKH